MARTPINHFSGNRAGWTTLQKLEVVVFVGDTDEFKAEHPTFVKDYERIKLIFRTVGYRKPLVLDLTAMTANELEEFKKAIDFAFDEARPVCEMLDEQAREAYANGDDSWSRLYRPDAKFILRGVNGPEQDQRVPDDDGAQRIQSEHDSSLPLGPDGCVDVDGGDPSERVLGPDDGGGGDRAGVSDEAADREGPFGGSA